jgi:hypothetical protein
MKRLWLITGTAIDSIGTLNVASAAMLATTKLEAESTALEALIETFPDHSDHRVFCEVYVSDRVILAAVKEMTPERMIIATSEEET